MSKTKSKPKGNRITDKEMSNSIFVPRAEVIKDSKVEIYEIEGKPCAKAHRGDYYIRVVSGSTLYSPYHERKLEPNVEWMECQPDLFGRYMKYLTSKNETDFKLAQRMY